MTKLNSVLEKSQKGVLNYVDQSVIITWISELGNAVLSSVL